MCTESIQLSIFMPVVKKCQKLTLVFIVRDLQSSVCEQD